MYPARIYRLSNDSLFAAAQYRRQRDHVLRCRQETSPKVVTRVLMILVGTLMVAGALGWSFNPMPAQPQVAALEESAH